MNDGPITTTRKLQLENENSGFAVFQPVNLNYIPSWGFTLAQYSPIINLSIAI
ncbi:hypothetical protein HYPBUDRAFT_154137 [Hyphopichia burtonii NRRL Y-1933]|uniref:Uncharacterized protein n=1 Tax=Hyphopichia burtonii NRRL Y-1933 TaxID=984485 RepID=A0A1E4RC33_9ASCO|nr:hypothetical protein HYPBUDRAFT_154137 [Hyphopichia burtonii NRRL Y-1933]ODV64796.1 hypothetical protein HYPBUDRAFT_154137 [Hyphopichia burtonii NRRL Y-1933]